ncbi:MAG: UDP-N-acetylmuramate dehydrogenase [Actinobacteria bacterium]|nr:UDP-N-acetylmuramate dehydrogenase [Actinomycetota bacterium]MDA8184676.1 UDP-N-acetylmuramate dehydrogenase [Actinomycetota bacterium]
MSGGTLRSSSLVLRELQARLGALARIEAPLGARTTYRVGGPAALMVEVSSEEDLARVHDAVASVSAMADVPLSLGGESGSTGNTEGSVQVLVLGKGSNLLVADSGFDGLVVALGPGLAWVEIEGLHARAGAATGLPVVARQTAHSSLTGFEWAVGVPGSLGGAVRMNAGGHGSDMAATLVRCRIFDLESGEARDVPARCLSLGYRSSTLSPHQVVVWGEMELAAGERQVSEATITSIVRWRRENQPGGSNAGSVFANPNGDSAGRLIEEAGLKGFRIGSAQVSPKHANFIQADEGGSADDVLCLIDHVKEEVARRSGVHLVPEVRLAGFRGRA